MTSFTFKERLYSRTHHVFICFYVCSGSDPANSSSGPDQAFRWSVPLLVQVGQKCLLFSHLYLLPFYKLSFTIHTLPLGTHVTQCFCSNTELVVKHDVYRNGTLGTLLLFGVYRHWSVASASLLNCFNIWHDTDLLYYVRKKMQ